MSSLGQRRLVWSVALLFTAFYVAQWLAKDAWLFQRLTERGVRAIGAIGKSAPLVVGSVFAARCAPHYEAGSTIRRAWIAMSVWLGGFALGQLLLSIYPLLLRREAPIPSIADPMYFVGYVALLVALVLFVAAYRASGFPVGRLAEHVAIGLGACALFGVVAYRMLLPIALAQTPLGERIVNVGYPLLDLVVLVPTLVLLRITVRFQGGRVWHVWAATLAGIVFFTCGDVLYADVSPEAQARLGPFVDLGFVLGFLFSGYGAVLQHELLTAD
jgi:hypothetical protein